MSSQSPAERAIVAALKHMGIFFESVSCGWVDAHARVVVLNEEDAVEVACWFSSAGWSAEAEGRVVRASVGAC